MITIRTLGTVFFAASFLLAARPIASQAAPEEVVFRVGENASIDWFAIDDPSVHGTLNVTNAPYDSTTTLNAAAVDLSHNRNRLIFDTNTAGAEGYAIDLSTLQLVQNGVTLVHVTDLGSWVGAGKNAGYRKKDDQVYFFVDGTLQFRHLDFGPTGLLTVSPDIRYFVGSDGPTEITGGDIDFAQDGSVWISGTNGSGEARLWHYDFTTLTLLSPPITMNNLYNGITFNASGLTLYGYKAATGRYGTIDTTNGSLSVLDPQSTLFGVNGDLATGTANITILPESGVPGDYNNSSVVDAADYVAWRKGNNPLYNEVATIGSNTTEDYTEWRARFGNTSGGGSLLGGATVPEPATLLLLFVGALSIPTRRRKSVPHNRV